MSGLAPRQQCTRRLGRRGPERHALAEQQKQWLGYRNACGSDHACLTEVHHQRIQQLQPTSLPTAGSPRAINSLTELPRPETAPPAEPAPALGLDPLEELKELR